mgnify:FL=1
MPPHTFLPKRGNYQGLIAYQKAECIYDITFYFAHTHLDKSDRTIDQMVQAARSGKQNIAEGSAASATSTETELKLINVARASLQELLADYMDYLRIHALEQWAMDSEKARQARQVCSRHNDTAYYRTAIAERSAETIANIAITLIHQEDVLLRKLLQRLEDDFVRQGGIKERMYAARTGYRQEQDAHLVALEAENKQLREENARLTADIRSLQTENARLREAPSAFKTN